MMGGLFYDRNHLLRCVISRIEPQIRRCRAGNVLIRTAETADAPQLIEIARAVMSEREFTLTEWEESGLAKWDESGLVLSNEEQWIQSALDHPDDLILVAEMSGAVVGLVNFATGRKRKIAHTGEFGMSVVAEWRDKGIGRVLLMALVDWAVAHPTVEKLDLGVFAKNSRAIHLYASAGFHQEGCRKNAIKFSEDNYDDLILMSKVIPKSGRPIQGESIHN